MKGRIAAPYLVRNARVRQLTMDDEYSVEIEGNDELNDFDVFALALRRGDTIVLCTDGAEEVVQDQEIVRVAGDLSPRILASRIVSAAHQRDAEQDATAVVVRVQGEHEPTWLALSTPSGGSAFGRALEFE